MENWYLVSFKFLDTGLWFYNLVLTDNEENIFKYFSGNEEIQFCSLETKKVNILKRAKLPIVDLGTR